MLRKTVPAAAVAAAALLCGAGVGAQESVDRIMNAVKPSAAAGGGLSIVRETALREAATTLGARQGLRDKSCVIRGEIEARREALDRKYRFSELMMGRGILPPIISEARDSVALDYTVMRVASRVYHLDEPARVIDIPPTWRDWLYVGLSFDSCGKQPLEAVAEQLKPKNSAEEAFFRAETARSYEMGRRQAAAVHEDNVARLERAYEGMRRFYHLYQRGMVSAPVIVSSTDVVRRDDPNTLVVGNTLIRITVPANFVEKADEWKPLSE